jgi:hypothetical protein
MAWTLSGEELFTVWAKEHMDQGKTVLRWHEVSDLTKNVWDALSVHVITQAKQLTAVVDGKFVNDDKISWMLGHLNHAERKKMYQMLHNMDYRVNR